MGVNNGKQKTKIDLPDGRACYSRRYPWARWFSKKSFSIAQGEDYHIRLDSMVQQIRNWGTRLRIKLVINVVEDGQRILVVNMGKRGK